MHENAWKCDISPHSGKVEVRTKTLFWGTGSGTSVCIRMPEWRGPSRGMYGGTACETQAHNSKIQQAFPQVQVTQRKPRARMKIELNMRIRASMLAIWLEWQRMSCSAVQHQEPYPRVTPSTSATFNEHCCPPSLPYPLPHRKAHTVRKPFVCDGYRVAHGDATKNKAPKFKTRPPRVSKTNTEPIFYFMWSPPWRLVLHTFWLILTFYLALHVALYLAFHLHFICQPIRPSM
jgi:hypothetical protein